MKAQFLKIAKCKTVKQFYDKYPTEAAFFKAHPEAKKMIKKAQAGLNVDKNNNGIPDYLENMNPNVGNIIQGQMQSPGVNAGMFQSRTQQSVGGPTYSPGNYNSWDIDNNGVPDTIQKPEGNPLNKSTPDYNQMYMSMSTADEQLKQPQGQQPSNANAMMQGGMNVIGGMFNAAKAMKAQKEALKNARMWADVSGVVKRAAISNQFAEKPKNTWIRPDDPNQIFNINQMYAGQGVGTNALARNGARLEDGGMVGGNPTEIQNTYGDGNSLFDDLGYVPLIDENQQKSFYHGGNVPRAQFGIASAGMEGFGENPYSSLTGSMFNNSGGSQMGSAVGSMFGPFGGLAGGMIGGMLDKTGGKTKDAQQRFQRNMDYVAGIDNTAGIHNQFNSVMEDGGWVSNDWNPQVITMFGDVDEQDFAQFAHKDEFRAGGHLRAYREPSERAMQTYAMGGELKTHWGGYAEPMSQNPYLPGSGETVMFRGKSHDESDGKGNTGIGITYGDNPVEVERGEPATKLKDGSSGEESLVVYGNLMIPKYGVEELGDKNAKGKKFKNYIADLSKIEARQNKLIEKSTNELNNLDVKNSFDKLKLTALEANIKGGNLKLKEIADKKIKAADLQNAINETAEEYGVVADDLARGKVKIDKTAMKEYAKFGKSIPKAQVGEKVIKGRGDRWSYTKAGDTGNPMWDDAKRYEQEWAPSVRTALADKERAKKMLDYINNSYGAESDKVKKSLNKFSTDEEKINFLITQGTNKEVGPIHHVIDAAIKYTTPGMTTPLKEEAKVEDKVDNQFETVPYKRSGLLDAFGQILPYIRPTDQEPLDPRQLAPEMLAKVQNRLEPVNMQKYNPMLDDLYDISYQDVLNENDSDFLTAVKGTDNPAMKANLLAQKYGANSKVLAEQFRANQSMRDKVFSGNRATLNNAQMTNLGLADKQYQRQQQALSNTKATDLEIAKSYADKYAKHALENKTLGVYENLYNYRYDKSGRAINMNAPFQPNIPYIYGNDGKPTHKIIYAKDKKTILGYEPVGKTTKIPSGATPPIVPEENVDSESYSPIDENDIMYQERNGGKTKKKKYSQSSIVRAFK